LLVVINFIIKLLLPIELIIGFVTNSIIVFNYRLTKEAYFMLFKEALDIKVLVYTFLKIIIVAYRFLDKIILDRDKYFTSKF
jgi:hypothetical protein